MVPPVESSDRHTSHRAGVVALPRRSDPESADARSTAEQKRTLRESWPPRQTGTQDSGGFEAIRVAPELVLWFEEDRVPGADDGGDGYAKRLFTLMVGDDEVVDKLREVLLAAY